METKVPILLFPLLASRVGTDGLQFSTVVDYFETLSTGNLLARQQAMAASQEAASNYNAKGND